MRAHAQSCANNTLILRKVTFSGNFVLITILRWWDNVVIDCKAGCMNNNNTNNSNNIHKHLNPRNSSNNTAAALISMSLIVFYFVAFIAGSFFKSVSSNYKKISSFYKNYCFCGSLACEDFICCCIFICMHKLQQHLFYFRKFSSSDCWLVWEWVLEWVK